MVNTMTEFPFAIVIHILFVLVLLIYWMFVFMTLYHLIRFGIGVEPKRFSMIFFLVSFILSVAAIVLYINIDINALLVQ